MAKIQTYRKLTAWETDNDGNSIGDEPTTVHESSDEFDCEPDEIDREEGLTRVELAAKVLNRRLHVTETSAYPWQPGSWYSANWESDMIEMSVYGAHHGEETAHLEGFTPEEERAIFELVKAEVAGMQ